jgi:hypothetical protein
MTKQTREGEANGPRGQRPSSTSRTGPNWAEFARLAHQAVVALVGAGTRNRAEPRACGHSRDPRRLDSEPGTERTAGAASDESRQRLRKGAATIGWCFQPYRGKLAVRDDRGGGGNVGMTWRPFATMLERADTSEAAGLNWARLRSTRPVSVISKEYALQEAHGDARITTIAPQVPQPQILKVTSWDRPQTAPRASGEDGR